MSDPRERDDIFRNRIADALRWSDENSDAAIERELAEIEAAPLRDDEVSRILGKAKAMRAEIPTRSVSEAESVPSPLGGEREQDSPTPAHGDAEMKTNPRVRPVNHSKPSGSSSVLAIVTSCACLLAALGLFQAVGVEDSESRIEPTASADSFAGNRNVALISVLPENFFPTPLKPQRVQAAPVQRVKVGDVVQTGARERRRVTLPDGSILFVNQNTLARIETPRRVGVDYGEVYVEAVPQNLLEGLFRKKFVIKAPDRSVTALGTRFAVKAAPETKTEVLVTQGEVAASGIETSLPSGRELVDSTRLHLAVDGKEVEGEPGFDSRTLNLTEVADGLVVQQAPRASEALSWTRELMAARIVPLIPPSKHRGGSLIVVDTEGQEMRLSLRKFHVDVHIEDGFARTTIDQTYFNHTQSRQEGTFHFPLPPDASLSRLAMYVNGKLMEGGMAERDHARNTFEEIVRSMKDPALLEWVDGSTFKMRVFPLEPRQEKRIVMSYTQRLSNDYGKETYRFPAGHNLDRVRDWSTQVKVAGGANLEWDSPSHFLKAQKPDGDLVLQGEAQRVTMKDDLVVELTDPVQKRAKSSTRFSMAEHEGQKYLMLRMRPDLDNVARLSESRSTTRSVVQQTAARPTRNWIFLFESSGDRDPVLARVQVDLIRTFLENAEHKDTFSIVLASSKAERFSVRPVPCVKKQITKAVDFMEDSHLLGALDLEAAFKMSGKLKSDESENWLVHVGSGIPAIGERDATTLERLLPKKTRYVGVGIGKRWNRPFMKAAAGRTGGHFDQINPDEKIGWRAFELFSTLNAPRLLDMQVVAVQENKDDIDPLFLNFADTIAHGQELCAVTRIPSSEELPKSLVVAGRLNGKEFRKTVKVKKVARNADYLPRSWSRLEIDRLVSLGANEHKDTIISLSKAMYVMSPFTSLLVLENEEMYKKYNIDRGRKDHWALYGAPPQIKVVHEPVMGPRPNDSPVEIRELLKKARAERDVARANFDLAVRDERSEKIIKDLEDQLQQRATHVNSLASQLKRHEANEQDSLTKLARTIVQKKPQVAGQQLIYYGDTTVYDSRTWTLSKQQTRQQRQKMLLDLLNRRGTVDQTDLETRIAQYELAYRMQPGYLLMLSDDNRNGIVDEFVNGTGLVVSNDGRVVSGFNRPWGIVREKRLNEWPRFTGRNGRFLRTESAFNQLPRPSLSQLRSLEGVDVSSLYYIPQSTVSGEAMSGIRFADTVPGRFGNRVDFDIDGDGYLVDYGLGADRNYLAHFGPLIVDQETLAKMNSHANFARSSGIVTHRMPPQYREAIENYYQRLGSFNYQTSRQQVQLTRELAEVMPQLVEQLTTDVEVRELDELGTIVVKGNQSDVAEVMSIIEKLERPAVTETVRVVPLSSQNPEELKVVLEALIDTQQEVRLQTEIATTQIQLREQLIDLSRRRLGGRIFERGGPDDVVWLNLQPVKGLEADYLLAPNFDVSPLLIMRPPGLLPDLTELMPGLQTLPADRLATIEAEGGEKIKVRRGKIDDKARKLIEKAHRTGWQHVVVTSLSADGRPVTVSINGAGKFRYERTLSSGQKETVICDGSTLWHLYPELGLAAKRPMSRFHREGLRSLFPWAVLPAEDLAVGANVRFVDEKIIELVPLKPTNKEKNEDAKKKTHRAVIVRLVFGDDGRLAEKQLVVGKKRELVMRTVFGKDGQVTIVGADGKDVTSWKIARTDSESIDLTPPTDGLVVLPLPYRSMDHVQPLVKQKGAYTSLSEDDALKVVASWFAAGNYGSLASLINERYIERNDNRLGFLTMISVWATHNTSVQPVFNSRKDPMAKFLVQYYDWRNFRNSNAEFTQSDQLPEFLQEFVRAHNLYTLWYSGRATQDRTRAQVNTELTRTLAAIRECPHEEFRWTLLKIVHQKIHEAKLMEGDFGRRLAAELIAFEMAGIRYADSAPYARIIWLLQARETKGLGKAYRELLVDVAEKGGVIILSDEIHKLFKQRLKGHREWTAAVKAVAKVLKKNRGPSALMALAEQLRSLEEKELANAFYMEALIDLKPADDPRKLQLLYGYVRRAEDWERAREFLTELLKDPKLARQSALWREAAVLSNELGNLDESLRHLEQALNLEFQKLPDAVDLKPFRETYGNLFDEYKALADKYKAYGANQIQAKSLPKDFLARVQAMADRWRTIDPDDTDVCQRAARIASQLGEADIAWGYWTTPLSEKPGDSTAWRNLAKEMGAQSSTELAARAFDQAFEIESTNPEILYEHAMMLRQAGEEDSAKKKLNEIVNGSWGRKFNGTRSKASRDLQQSP